MRYSRSQWKTFVVLVVLNAAAVVVLVLVTDAPGLAVVAYAVAAPVVFRLIVVASDEFDLRLAVRGLAVWRAMRRRQIVLYLQPKVLVATGAVEGAEALARWEHPKRGLLPPGQWLPAVAQSRRLERLFWRYTLDAACHQAWAWRKAGKDLKLCLNVSPAVFSDQRAIRDVADRLAEWELPPTAIYLEMTETALFSAGTEARAHELAELGVALGLDDFGTGQSSMSRLVELPFSMLKIDRSFVTGMLTDHRKRSVARSACSLSHSLGLQIIAEGIETVDVLRALSDFGCDAGQGYLFSRPLPAQEFDRWLEDNQVPALMAVSVEPPDRRAILRRREDRFAGR